MSRPTREHYAKMTEAARFGDVDVLADWINRYEFTKEQLFEAGMQAIQGDGDGFSASGVIGLTNILIAKITELDRAEKSYSC